MCPLCEGTGWQQVEKDGVSGVVRCDCRKRSRASRILVDARIPERYAHCDLEVFEIGPPLTTRSIEQAKLAAAKFVEEYPMSPPFGLLFMGRPGVGKTHLAVGIIKRLMREKSVECLFRTFPELLKEIQNSYNPRTEGLGTVAPGAGSRYRGACPGRTGCAIPFVVGAGYCGIRFELPLQREQSHHTDNKFSRPGRR